ncbi:acetolactate decarboxylase [Leuconostocaceae bacterium ESL0958]|nr:acetolactate decarboxylase [Leuconostocaceae bacterium ESL0958]
MTPVVQFGTMQMLVERLLDGFVTAKDLLAAGNTGIGTGAGVDGELILLDGRAYQVNGDGQVREIPADFPVTFGDVHQADFKLLKRYENVSLADLTAAILAEVASKNLFFSFKVTGTFNSVDTRSAAKSEKPYPGLEEIAKRQRTFHRDQVQGTLIGYYTPALYHGVGVGGFHQHFLSDDLDFGGHVLAAEAQSVSVSIQVLSGLDLKLPVDNADYRQADLDNLNQLHEAIHSAES